MIGLRTLCRFVSVLFLTLALSSCYIPDKFRSELRLSRYGDYALSYEGDLIYAPIMHDYADGRITADNEEERNNNIYKDLVRDTAFKALQRVGKGRFRGSYERTGHIGEKQLIALLRRDARLLAMKDNGDGTIVVAANAVKPSDAQAMAELGITMQGEFRITTDAVVLRHNANEVRPFGQYRVYVWKIENPLSPAPNLIFRRDPLPGTTN